LEPDGTVFLRVHNTTKFGDSIKFLHFLSTAMETKQLAGGVELTPAGYSLATARPYEIDGKVAGFIIVGGTFEGFLAAMKNQTSDDYVMIGYKDRLNESLYRSAQKQWNLPDTWDQFRGVVVLSQTAEVLQGGDYESALANLPAEGKVLGEFPIGDRIFVRGVFPLLDATGKATGGIFVRHDITPLHAGMQRVQVVMIIAIIALMGVISVLIAFILNRLVFARIRRTMEVATRVVGGELETRIVPESADEVGQLEELLEQFRGIFVGIARELAERQAKDGS
jgi:HAMP domain-containing protein